MSDRGGAVRRSVTRYLWWKVAGVLAVPLLCLVALIGVVVAISTSVTSSCGGGPPGQTVGPGGAVVPGFTAEQLTNAATIMNVAAGLGLSRQGQTIGVMVALGESTLINIGHGDLVGPDSTGLFQQRNPWGPRPDRMDPAKAAGMFFTGGQGGQPGLVDVPGWETLQPTIAAHRVQRNADPFHYDRFWNDAQRIVAALIAGPGAPPAGALPVGNVQPAVPPGCPQTGSQVAAGAQGWANPVPAAHRSSGYGPRSGGFHYGQDLAAPLGTPIYAAADGTVISAGPASGYGQWIRVDHGGGVVTIYGHMYPPDLMVRVGDRVKAGQQIARVGNNGQSTGPHCHLQVEINGHPVDPAPFMSSHGAPLAV